MSLLKYEIKKLLRPGVLAVVIPLLLIPVFLFSFVNSFSQFSFYRYYGSSEARYAYSRPYEGPIKQDTATKAIAQAWEDISREQNPQYTDTDKKPADVEFNIKYSLAWLRLENFRHGEGGGASGAPYSLDGVAGRMEQLKSAGKDGTYEYKALAMQLDMLKKSGEPQYFYAKPWESLFGTLALDVWCAILLIVLIIIAVPVFSTEYSTGMDSIIFSAKKGRARIVTAKLTALMLIASGIVLVTNLFLFVCSMGAGGVFGAKAPLKSIFLYFLTPYSLNMLQFYLVQLGLQLLGCLITVLVTAFISSRLASTLSAFLISVAAVFYPFITIYIFPTAKWLEPVYYLSVARLAAVRDIFTGFRAFNIFGYPVLYPYLLIPLAMLLGAAMAVLTYRSVKYREVK